MAKLTWNTLEDIALALYEKFPEQDPATKADADQVSGASSRALRVNEIGGQRRDGDHCGNAHVGYMSG